MVRGFIVGVVVTLVVLAIAGFVVLWTGAIPANADVKPGGFERHVAGIWLRATLRNEAPKGPNPVELNDANLIAGVQLYANHCSVCHGTAAKDAPPTNIAKGENPEPPQLAREGVEDDPEGVTFWKIKHGIRWTGMPAWKDELDDKQIWTLALFLKHMDDLPPAAAKAWQQTAVSATH